MACSRVKHKLLPLPMVMRPMGAQSAFSGLMLLVVATPLMAADPQLGKLQALWKDQRRAVITAEFEVEFLQYSAPSSAQRSGGPITRERFEQFLDRCRAEWGSNGDNAPLCKISAELDISPPFLAQFWKRGLIRVDGQKLRNSFRNDLVPGGLPTQWDFAFDGNVDVCFLKESNQVTVREKEVIWQHFGLDDLWTIGPIAGPAKVSGRSDGRLILDSRLGTYTVDPATGAVLTVVTGPDRTGRRVDQFGFGQYGAGNAKIAFPSVHSSFDFVDGQVTLGFLFVVRSARFNPPLDDKKFAIPVAAGTIVSYFSSRDKMFSSDGPSKPGYVTRLEKPVDDARLLLPALQAGAARMAAPSPPSLPPAPAARIRWGPVLLINSTVTVLLGAYFYFTRRLRRR
jgi:hypothetical protein